MGFFIYTLMEKPLNSSQENMTGSGIDWSNYKEYRLSDEQIESATNLVFDDPELEEYAYRLLEDCHTYYENNEDFRKRREECRDFYKGDHWNAKMKHPDTGEWITQKEYIQEQNMVPLKQNQIRQILKNMLGQFRDNNNDNMVVSRDRNKQQLGEMMTKALQYSKQANQGKELDVRLFEEFLISGYFGCKTSYRYISKRDIEDVWIDMVHANRIFYNTGITDIRLHEIHTIGEILDMRLEDIISNFAKNEADAQTIREWYGAEESGRRNRASYGMTLQDSSIVDNIDFYTPEDPSTCRVFEIWEKINTKVFFVHDPYHAKTYTTTETEEELQEQNNQRIQEGLAYGIPMEAIQGTLLDWETRYEDIWHFWFLTPNGKILYHGETPYDHQETPYTIGLYPLVDGNVWGMVYDILDQQKQINRLLTMMDKIIGASAKGVLLVPEGAVPEGWDIDDFASEWTKSNGVIKYKPLPGGQKPEQIQANSLNVGAIELLQIQFNLLREISGITDAIQGQRPAAGTPSSLYAQQTNNAALNNRDYFDFFNSRLVERDFKIVKLQQQYYEEDRMIIISGQEFDNAIDYYEVDKVKDLEFEMAMGPGMNSTVFRQVYEDALFKFLEMGLIDRDIYLKTTSMPFADKLRSAINEQQVELQKAQEQLAATGGDPAGNPQAMQLLQQYAGMGGQQPMQGAA